MRRLLIRKAHKGDIAAIRAINESGQPGVSPLSSEELRQIARGDVRCWVAERDSMVAGYLIAYDADAPYDGEEFAWFRRHLGSFLYIDQVSVAPNRQRTGTATRLYEIAERHARHSHLAALVCEVNLHPPNPVSLAFHAHRGFSQIATLRTSDGRMVSLQQRSHIQHPDGRCS